MRVWEGRDLLSQMVRNSEEMHCEFSNQITSQTSTVVRMTRESLKITLENRLQAKLSGDLGMLSTLTKFTDPP